MPPFVTRGVVLDMTAVDGKNPVPAGTPFNKKEIDEALAKQGIQIKKGDVVLFHTGWQDMAARDPKAFMAGEPGLGKEGAEYLVSKEVLAVGADQWGLEVFRSKRVSACSRSIRSFCRGTGSTSWRT